VIDSQIRDDQLARQDEWPDLYADVQGMRLYESGFAEAGSSATERSSAVTYPRPGSELDDWLQAEEEIRRSEEALDEG